MHLIKRISLKAAIFVLIIALWLPTGGMLLAQESDSGLSKTEERAQLEAELKKLEAEIATYETNISKTQAEKKTLQNQIYILRNQINKLDAQIAQSNKLIEDLNYQIGDTEASIEQTYEHVEITKEQLRELIQRLYQEDQKPLLEVLFSGADLSDFFENVVALETLNVRNRELLEQYQNLSIILSEQKSDLQSEQEAEENFIRIQLLQKQESLNVSSQRERLLRETQGKEAEYQRLLEDRRKKAQEIRSRIFELVGVPQAPTFGQALAIARNAEAATGVRAELLLAVLTQESNLGKNVGQCYLKNSTNGDGIVISTGRAVRAVMKPTRDVQPFIKIVTDLGKDPYFTAVSCPIPSVGGYGGAMGPAQFIPSTWIAYKPRLDDMLGRPGDPWNISDAFMAAALYLGDAGARAQTYQAEWRAAMVYFSGSTNPRYSFYGDSVMAIVKQYEEDVKALDEF